MINVRLRNPEIILAPITEEEKEIFESEFMGDENIYVLYRLPEDENIHIGMMSTSMRRYFPMTANVWRLDEAVSKAYFYNGGANLEIMSVEILDRPVYRVRPTEDRLVSGYDVINSKINPELRIWLEDIVDGRYVVNGDVPFGFGK